MKVWSRKAGKKVPVSPPPLGGVKFSSATPCSGPLSARPPSPVQKFSTKNHIFAHLFFEKLVKKASKSWTGYSGWKIWAGWKRPPRGPTAPQPSQTANQPSQCTLTPKSHTSVPGLASQRKLEQMPFLAGSSRPNSGSQYVARRTHKVVVFPSHTQKYSTEIEQGRIDHTSPRGFRPKTDW